MHKYRLIAKKGEGTFSEVLKAQSIKNGKYLAIKCMKNHFDSIEQVNNLREIQALRRLSPHPNIIKLYEVLYDQPTGRLALVFELMDCNIYELIRGRRHYLPEQRVKLYMYQLCKAMDHMHRNGIFHRDIKPENVLIIDELLKVADFGSCRGIYSKQPYTEYISTRWYRAPECLLTDGYYGYKMDMWGVGCVMFEILALFPLFPGTNEMDQITKIHNVMGTPPPDVLNKFKRYASHIDFNFPPKEGTGISKLLPHVTAEAVDIIEKLLAYDPEDRISARQALRHPWFSDLRAMEKKQAAAAAASSGSNASGGQNSARPTGTMAAVPPPAPAGESKAKEADSGAGGGAGSGTGGGGGSSVAAKSGKHGHHGGHHGAAGGGGGTLPGINKGHSTRRSNKTDASAAGSTVSGSHGHHGGGTHHGGGGGATGGGGDMDATLPPIMKSMTNQGLSIHGGGAGGHAGGHAGAAHAGGGGGKYKSASMALGGHSYGHPGHGHGHHSKGRKASEGHYSSKASVGSKKGHGHHGHNFTSARYGGGSSKYGAAAAARGGMPAASGASGAGSSNAAAQAAAMNPKYLSPYSQKFISSKRDSHR